MECVSEGHVLEGRVLERCEPVHSSMQCAVIQPVYSPFTLRSGTVLERSYCSVNGGVERFS